MPYRNGKIVNWKVKIKGIKELLTDDTSDENAQRVGKEVYKILTSKRYGKYFEDFGMGRNMSFYCLDEFDTVDTCEYFNVLLNELYDYCDAKLIWLIKKGR